MLDEESRVVNVADRGQERDRTRAMLIADGGARLTCMTWAQDCDREKGIRELKNRVSFCLRD